MQQLDVGLSLWCRMTWPDMRMSSSVPEIRESHTDEGRG